MFPKLPFVCLLLVVTLVHGSPAGIGDVFGTIKKTVVDNNPVVGVIKDVTNVGGQVTKPITDALKDNPVNYVLDTLKSAVYAGQLGTYISKLRDLITQGSIREALQLVVSPKFISALRETVNGLVQNKDLRNVLQTLIFERVTKLVANIRSRYLNA